MKTVSSIKKEISTVSNEVKELEKSTDTKDAKVARRLRKKIPYLKSILMYLETNPTKEFVEKEKARIENRIELLMKNYAPPLNQTKTQQTVYLKWYKKEMGINKIEKQLTNINFILRN